jgi:sterol desaturase/sphingolipid hydroxylase (fatty acid hydroxylase superfamily)
MKDYYNASYLESFLQIIGFLLPLLLINVNFNYIHFGLAFIFVNIRGLLQHDYRFIWMVGNHHLLHHQYPKYNFSEYWIDKMFETDKNESSSSVECVVV